MGTFDDWKHQRDGEFISIVEYLDDMARKNDSTIKATISYLFEQNYFSSSELYIHSGLRVVLISNKGWTDKETPTQILTAIFSEISNPIFGTDYKFIPPDISNKYAIYLIKRSALPIIEQPKQYYSQGVVEQIVKNADIVKIIGKHVELKRSGNEFKGCCPFHGEKTPSFFVNSQKGVYNCFGCGASGNALTFLTKYEQLSAQDALLELSRQTGIALPQNNDTFTQKSAPLNEKQQYDEILERDPLLIKLDSFSVVEAACLISGDDFIDIERCYQDTNFDRNYPNFIRAERLINSGLDSRSLSDLSSQSLKYFLKDKGYIIRDFNDALPAKIDAFAQLDISQTSSANTELSQQVEKLQHDLATANATILDLGQQLKQAIADRDNLQSTLDAISQTGEINTSEYNTSALLALRAVVNEYWLNYDPSKPKTAPKQDHIRSWIKDNYPDIPPSFGLWIDRIARHPTAK